MCSSKCNAGRSSLDHMHLIDIDKLPSILRSMVIEELKEGIWATDRLLTYKEAAHCYGYTYGSIRALVCQGYINKSMLGRKSYPRISHAEMARYINSVSSRGCPKKSERTPYPHERQHTGE